MPHKKTLFNFQFCKIRGGRLLIAAASSGRLILIMTVFVIISTSSIIGISTDVSAIKDYILDINLHHQVGIVSTP